MEIIFALIVFFGGFTLGSIATDKDDASSQSIKINDTDDNRARSHQSNQATQVNHSNQIIFIEETSTCYLSNTYRYRDLTRTHHAESESLASEWGGCEEGHSDE